MKIEDKFWPGWPSPQEPRPVYLPANPSRMLPAVGASLFALAVTAGLMIWRFLL
jgi:hypothetical protein